MKPLGIVQFHEKKYKFLGFTDEWKNFIGDPGENFVGVIYGQSGQGKTEFTLRLAKYFCSFSNVAWISYEQGHDYDLQKATIRNKMEEVAGKFIPIDPFEKRNPKKTLIQELEEYIAKRSSARIVFIDSIDYLEPDLEWYKHIKRTYGKKKIIIFISHEGSDGKPDLKVTKKIAYDGKLTIRVFKFLARTVKNRLGGSGNYCIWEKEARRLDPIFFKKVEAEIETVHNLETTTA